MEPQLSTPPPVPTPPSAPVNFHKSVSIVALAYLELILYVLSWFGGMISIFPFSIISIFSIAFLIPAILIIFTKDKKTYKIARILLIIEYVVVPLIIIVLLYLLFTSSWGSW